MSDKSKVDFSSGVKYDIGKVRYDLVPPEIEEALAKVFTVGAIKYKPRNCETGFEFGRLYAAARRHMAEWAKGYDLDTDSGMHHLCAASWSLLMIYLCQVRGIGTDDRSPYLLEKSKESSINGITSSGTEVKFAPNKYEVNLDNVEMKSGISTVSGPFIATPDNIYSWPITPLNTSGFEVSDHTNLTSMLVSMGCPIVDTNEHKVGITNITTEQPMILSEPTTCANFEEDGPECLDCEETGNEPCYIKKILDEKSDVIKNKSKLTNEEIMKELESRLDKLKTENTIYVEY